MKTIPFVHLLYLLIPLLVTWYFYYIWTKDKKEILYSTLRMVLQLLLIGYVLIFIFENKEPFLGVAIILFMALVSSQITLRNVQDKTLKHYGIILSAILGSVLVHLFIIVVFVLDLESIYEPRYVIPIAGMIFANTMNALSLAIERFEKETLRNVVYEEAREIAYKACMIPQINSLLAVGLVALPGMMTGQILSGIDPLIAVRYQIMIMIMVLSSAGISTALYFTFKEKL